MATPVGWPFVYISLKEPITHLLEWNTAPPVGLKRPRSGGSLALGLRNDHPRTRERIE